MNELLPWAAFLALLIPYLLKEFRGNSHLQTNSGSQLVADTKELVDTAMNMNKRLQSQVENLFERVDKLEAGARVHRRWNEMLSQQVRALRGTPVTYEEAAEAAGVSLKLFDQSYSDLRREIAKAFDKTELDLLARDIGIDPGEIGGETLSERVAELVSMASRRRGMKQLQAQIRKARSNFPQDVLEHI